MSPRGATSAGGSACRRCRLRCGFRPFWGWKHRLFSDFCYEGVNSKSLTSFVTDSLESRPGVGAVLSDRRRAETRADRRAVFGSPLREAMVLDPSSSLDNSSVTGCHELRGTCPSFRSHKESPIYTDANSRWTAVYTQRFYHPQVHFDLRVRLQARVHRCQRRGTYI